VGGMDALWPLILSGMMKWMYDACVSLMSKVSEVGKLLLDNVRVLFSGWRSSVALPDGCRPEA
jgi:hypothetical protein